MCDVSKMNCEVGERILPICSRNRHRYDILYYVRCFVVFAVAGYNFSSQVSFVGLTDLMVSKLIILP